MRNASLIYIVASLLLSFILWSSWFEIDAGVRSEGSLVPKGRTQIVQVVDGGVLAQLLVNEGDYVKKGQVIARLEGARVEARKNELESKYATLTVARIRTEAISNKLKPDFSGLPKEWKPVIKAQQKLYEQNTRKQIQLLASLKSSVALKQNEYNLHKKLVDNGSYSNLRLVEIKLELNDRKREIQEATSSYIYEALKEQADIDSELFTLGFSIIERQNFVEKVTIKAPKNGLVTHLNFSTIGATISPGETLMSISPTDEILELELKILPSDVGLLRVGLPVKIRLAAFDSTIYGELQGTLIRIGADVSKEQKGGQEVDYFKATAIIDWSSNHRIETKLIRSGMTATADITTGSRTVLEYLLKPIKRGMTGVMLEH